ncbi:MAG: efflux RND transporter periplasmic adaptor subunit [Rhodospirillales bacterium]|nr:efflux RND transporter periplasmic adaptor subunit [Rhodospirillales bacterium]
MHVVVAEAVEQPVTIERTYTGTTAAARAVDLRAQVTGYLVERRFTEGSSVATGDTLFVIDARPFQTVVDQRQAELQEQQAVLRYADAAQQRYAAAAKLGAAAQDRLDQAIELQIKTQAAIGVHQAELAQAQFNLEMTDIKAPFDGRVGRALVDVGALVEGNKTALASLVQLNPVYVYFSPPNADLPLIEAQQEKAPVQVTVTFPHVPSEALRGTLTFISNAADATTGTIAMRATIADPPKAVRPGQFVQVRLNLVDAFEALVVPADAVSAVQGQTYVMVVGDDNRIARRKVRLGQDGADQGRIVEDGLSRGERVVVSDTRALRAGELVSTEPAPAR